MVTKYWSFVPRNPRHKVAEDPAARVELRRSAANLPALPEVAVVDFSRSGFRLSVTEPLAARESVTLRLVDERSGMDLTLPGIVRWQRREADGTWSVGCHCDRELDWETLGELFLGGILLRDETLPQPSDHAST